MPTRPRMSSSGFGAGWPASRRILVLALVLTLLLVCAGLVAFLTGRNEQPDNPHVSPPATSSASPSKDAPSLAEGGFGAVAGPAQISEPLAYAKAAATMLWSYDTRTTSRDQQLAGMKAWMTTESSYADWAAVAGQVPDPLLWSRMADNAQHATARTADARFPSAFRQALAEDPSALTEAYIYAVTVTGKQKITWAGGGGAEDRSVTLAVQCRPAHDCALVSIAPQVAP